MRTQTDTDRYQEYSCNSARKNTHCVDLSGKKEFTLLQTRCETSLLFILWNFQQLSLGSFFEHFHTLDEDETWWKGWMDTNSIFSKLSAILDHNHQRSWFFSGELKKYVLRRCLLTLKVFSMILTTNTKKMEWSLTWIKIICWEIQAKVLSSKNYNFKRLMKINTGGNNYQSFSNRCMNIFLIYLCTLPYDGKLSRKHKVRHFL